MARGVADSLARGRHLLVEAGTGVGKSLAYLVPAILHAAGRTEDPARRVVVSTFTRALQEQLARQDLPLLERAFEREGLAFRHALLMGSENYLCVQRLEQARRNAGPDRALDALDRHAESAVSGLRSEIPFSVPEGTWGRVRRERDVCLGSRGPFWDRCLYRRDLQRAREAEVLVVNHALFFLDLASGGRVLPPHGVVVLDEAHRAEEAAAGQLGARLGPGSVERLLRDIAPAARGRRAPRDPSREPARRRTTRGAAGVPGARLAEAVRLVEIESAGYFEAARRVARQLAERDGPSAVRLPAGALDRTGLSASFADLEEALDKAASASDDLFDRGQIEGLRQRAVDLRGRLEQFTTQPQADAVYWIETRGAGDGVDLAFAPIEVGPILRRTLFESNRTVVLTSATLTVARSFAHARDRLGLTASGAVALGSPFDYRRQALLYLPEGLPDPGSDPRGWGEAVSAECRRVIEASDGGALLLFTSWALLDRVHRDLSADAAMRARPLLRHVPDGTATDLLERFRASRRAVLLGALTFWQGVDVPGEALRAVVVTRLPFEVPDHPLARARAAAIAARGGDPFLDDSLPEAILTFRQGFGRLIRTRRDFGLVAVLDPRLTSRAYGARFLESIPPCPKTSSIEEVTRFFARAGADPVRG